jgi:hypothetical protein
VASNRADRARDCLRTLWAIRHCHDRKLKTIVRGLIREDVARLRGRRQPRCSR